jgi:hypothetical protein
MVSASYCLQIIGTKGVMLVGNEAVDRVKLKEQFLSEGMAVVKLTLKRAMVMEKLLSDAYRTRSYDLRKATAIDRLRFGLLMTKVVARQFRCVLFHADLLDVLAFYHLNLPAYRVLKSSTDVIFEFRRVP